MPTLTTPASADDLFPEEHSMKLAMDAALIGNLPKLRDHFMLTEQAAEEMGRSHTSMLTGVIPHGAAAEVHDRLVSGLTHPPIGDEDAETRTRQSETSRQKFMEEGRAEYGFAWDRVFTKAREMVQSRPALVKVLKDAGLENDPTFWRAACRRAQVQLKTERKL